MRIQPEEPCPCGSGNPYGDCHGRHLSEQPEITRLIPLQVIPEPDPETRSVLQAMGPTPLFRGTESSVAYTCGSCNAPLVIGVDIGRLQNVVLGCGSCNSFNETRPQHKGPATGKPRSRRRGGGRRGR
jgi:hypothetical protein